MSHKKDSKYYHNVEIPVKVVENRDRILNEPQKEIKFGLLKPFLKKTSYGLIVLFIISANVFALSAFEAHVINVTARICTPSETHTIGFWRNHLEDYNGSCLPQYLGDEEIGTIEQAYQIFNDANADVMEDMLKGQLLAMKFNIGCLDIDPTEGEEFDGETLEEIVARADDILRDPDATREEETEIKDLLDYLNNLEQIKYCSTGNNFFVESQDSLSAMVYNFLSGPISNQSPDEKDGSPETYIIIAYPNSPTTNPEAYFAFNSSTRSATFQCKINSVDWVNCTSPKTYSGLVPGDYQFQVFATNDKGKYDETPATYSWTILGAAEPSLTEQSPSEQPPVEEPPLVEEPPIEEPLIEEEPPIEELPTEEFPIEEPPIEESASSTEETSIDEGINGESTTSEEIVNDSSGEEATPTEATSTEPIFIEATSTEAIFTEATSTEATTTEEVNLDNNPESTTSEPI